jgi:hypothetical protein
MTELQRALFKILLKLRTVMGEGTARKNLTGKGTPGDYLNHMLGWLGTKLGEPPLQPRSRWGPGRRPTQDMTDLLMRAALPSAEFRRRSQELAETIQNYKSLAGFPNLDAILRQTAGADAWIEFFRELVQRAFPKKSADSVEAHRPSWLVLPERRWRRGVDQPGLLLRADNEIVPFQGRAVERQELRRWCADAAPFALRCYTGAGGMGKTRLGLELCRQMRGEGWLCGLVVPARLPGESSTGLHLPRLRVPALLVVDYAEHHRGAVLDLIRWGAAEVHEPKKLRVLLLARSAGEWWQLAHDDAQAGGALRNALAVEPVELTPVAMGLEERRRSFEHAVAAFASAMGRPVPRRRSAKLQAPYFGKILWLHMAALLAIEGRQVTGEYAILDEVLRRERRYWRKLGETFQISAPLLRLLGRAVCVLTATEGVADRRQAVSLLRGIPGFRDQPDAILESIATLLHECFPGQQWIEPLQPDRLGDRLVELETDRNEDLFAEFVPQA